MNDLGKEIFLAILMIFIALELDSCHINKMHKDNKEEVIEEIQRVRNDLQSLQWDIDALKQR